MIIRVNEDIFIPMLEILYFELKYIPPDECNPKRLYTIIFHTKSGYLKETDTYCNIEKIIKYISENLDKNYLDLYFIED